jgi:23S rRNA pseudouridine2605 synthase
MDNKIRINKYLSSCGLGSRRKVEELIENKKIMVNGQIIHNLALTVDPEKDIVKYKNQELKLIEKFYYLILNKPKGYLTSVSDDHNRPIVMDLIPEKYKRAMINPVGRLDKDSEGLLLFTNDGDAAYKLTHPKFKIKKEYIVELDKPLLNEDKIKIEKGVFLYGEKTRPAKIESQLNNKVIKISITEGKKRHIRLTFHKFSYKVKKLKRIAFGPIKLGHLFSGSHRLLRKDEIRKLQQTLKSEII